MGSCLSSIFSKKRQQNELNQQNLKQDEQVQRCKNEQRKSQKIIEESQKNNSSNKNINNERREKYIEQNKSEELEDKQIFKNDIKINKNQINSQNQFNSYFDGQLQSNQQNQAHLQAQNGQYILKKPHSFMNNLSQINNSQHNYQSYNQQTKMEKHNSLSRISLLSTNFSNNSTSKMYQDNLDQTSHCMIFSSNSIQQDALQLNQKEILKKTDQNIDYQSSINARKINQKLSKDLDQQQLQSQIQIQQNHEKNAISQDFQKECILQTNNILPQSNLEQNKQYSNTSYLENKIQDCQTRNIYQINNNQYYSNLQQAKNDSSRGGEIENTKALENVYFQQNIITDDQKRQNALKYIPKKRDEQEEEQKQTYKFNQFLLNIQRNQHQQIQNNNYNPISNNKMQNNQMVDYSKQQINDFQIYDQQLNNQNYQINFKLFQNLSPINSVMAIEHFEKQPENNKPSQFNEFDENQQINEVKYISDNNNFYQIKNNKIQSNQTVDNINQGTNENQINDNQLNYQKYSINQVQFQNLYQKNFFREAENLEGQNKVSLLNNFDQNIQINQLKYFQNNNHYQQISKNQIQNNQMVNQEINQIQIYDQQLNNLNYQINSEQFQNLSQINSVEEEENFESQSQNHTNNSIQSEEIQSPAKQNNEICSSLNLTTVTKNQQCSMLGHKSNSNKTKFDLYFQMIKLNNFSQAEIIDQKKYQYSLELIDFQKLKYYKQFMVYRKYQYFQQKQQQKSKDEKEQEALESQHIEQQMLNKVIQNNYDLQECGQEIALLALKNIYSQKEITLLFKKQQEVSNDDNDEQINHTMNSSFQQNPQQYKDSYDDIQQHIAQTGFDLGKYYRIRINDSKEWNFQKAEKQKLAFAKYFKSEIIKKCKNLKKDDITILNVQQGSIIVDFHCHQHIENIQIGNQKFDYIPTKYIISELQITEDYFDPEYDMFWEETDEIFYRGNINGQDQQYHLPVGYTGLGLKVLNNGIYPNDGWLNSDTSDATWIVLFHATFPEFVNKILQEGLKAGDGQYCQNERCRFQRGQVGIGVYFSNKIKNCEEYGGPIDVGEKKFRLIFQCRVNPKTIKSPEENDEYYVCNNPQDTRPYRILIKEYQNSQES